MSSQLDGKFMTLKSRGNANMMLADILDISLHIDVGSWDTYSSINWSVICL